MNGSVRRGALGSTALLCLLQLLTTIPATAQDAGTAPRVVRDPAAAFAGLPAGTRIEQVVLKFREGSDVRLQGGQLQAPPSANLPSLPTNLRGAGADPGTARRLHDRPPAALAAEREQASRRSGRALADLNLYYVLDVPAGTDPAAFVARLNALPGVEFAEPVPPPAPLPVDLAPPSPDLEANQGYRGTSQGVGLLDEPGGDGAGTSLVDIEYAWTLDHEDLELAAAANIDTRTARDPFGDSDNHGTAVLGEIGGRANGYGVTGLAPGARLLVAPASTFDFGYNLARAISLATGRLGAGDVILIEQQTWVCTTGNYGPSEWSQAVFDAIATASAAGITVVEAAGNGNVDLDSSGCGGVFDRSLRDSGAIIVGAGAPGTRAKLGFSSFGSRVDVHGWGSSVATSGYGDAFNPGDARQRYTSSFSGTSSASPIVAGVVLQIQGALKARGLRFATPLEMREALRATGAPQAAGSGQIGPLPNTAAAFGYLLDKIAPGPRWRGWESFAGASATNPECLANGAGGIDCWTRLATGSLGWWRYAGSGTPALRAIAGPVAAPPSCLVVGGRLTCFAVLPSGRLGQTVLSGSTWSAWTDRGGALKRKPACATADGSRVICVGLGTDGRLMERSGIDANWGAWRAIGGTLRFNHPPTCYARGPGIDCIAADRGFRGRFLARAANGTWSTPKDLGGPVDDVPSCVAPKTTTRTCFFKGNDRGLKRVFFNGAAWTAIENLGGVMDSAPSCTLLGPSPYCFAIVGTSLQVKRNIASAWQNWASLGGSLRPLRPACLATNGTRIDCFALGGAAELAHNAYR